MEFFSISIIQSAISKLTFKGLKGHYDQLYTKLLAFVVFAWWEIAWISLHTHIIDESIGGTM